MSNDDGVHAPGLLALYQALSTIAEVVVVAPSNEQSGCASVIANLPSGHEEADRTTIRIGHSMQLGVHAALRAADQASRTPLFTPRLDAVRCALR